MTNYLLDTHIIVWLITNDDRLDKNIREEIEYCQNNYFVSTHSLEEIIQLQLLGKIKLNLKYDDLIIYLSRFNITIVHTALFALNQLSKMKIMTIHNKKHTDMIYRVLIAEAIAYKYIIISSDGYFPSYRKIGLQLLEN
ncbi:MAG: hypothetical protein PHU62_07820 [Bacteroidales bacterium]|jgi:PIN domain nuclease of toxin-antitoxin system|nr:hypothetical protein [Bacteroidales bacterium]MDD2205114.1 hypothetical protein [Bacteroidales bacterium]MDD3152560.1 hypothetical protein [Bacteroidales bacterium]MDD3914596.1 hypothetical protein [Bacteroidales bacterium]MDD4634459.1 hypothetical protein [Bacteroidales bacterium]